MDQKVDTQSKRTLASSSMLIIAIILAMIAQCILAPDIYRLAHCFPLLSNMISDVIAASTLSVASLGSWFVFYRLSRGSPSPSTITLGLVLLTLAAIGTLILLWYVWGPAWSGRSLIICTPTGAESTSYTAAIIAPLAFPAIPHIAWSIYRLRAKIM